MDQKYQIEQRKEKLMKKFQMKSLK